MAISGDSVVGLTALALRPLLTGRIKPAQWLLSQLQTQAEGLSGHLDEFWPSIRDSGWIGGKDDGWERGPYWLDGLVPLAFALDDARLKAKVDHWMDYILSHQQADGWIGPTLHHADGTPNRDTWPLFVFLKAATQYHEATEDPRVIPAMQRLLRCVQRHIAREPIQGWGSYRSADLLLSVYWLYKRDPEAYLLELAETIRQQSFDWIALFAKDYPYTSKTTNLPKGGVSSATHGPNNAMGVKQPAVYFRTSHDGSLRATAERMIDTLDLYHGQANGMFSCDEHLAGRHPSQGSETCAVVEYMFSLEVLLATWGNPRHGDLLETLAFNALPAPFKPDMWARQYDQQANQVVCDVSPEPIYTDNGPDANMYGLETHFGCCTANFHQGWPKFVQHLWMRSPDGGLAAISYAPCDVTEKIGDSSVAIHVTGEYPFRQTVDISVGTDVPVKFPIWLRIPAWADDATVSIEGEKMQAAAGAFFKLERLWTGSTQIVLHLPMRPTFSVRTNNAVSIHYGPLLLALYIPDRWSQTGGTLPHADWAVQPAGAWNVALRVDRDTGEGLTIEELPIRKGTPFSPESSPLAASGMAAVLPEWTLRQNAADLPPESPVVATARLERVRLLPYGATNLRISEIPTLSVSGKKE